MMCLGYEPRAIGDDGWKAQMYPLSYVGPLYFLPYLTIPSPFFVILLF